MFEQGTPVISKYMGAKLKFNEDDLHDLLVEFKSACESQAAVYGYLLCWHLLEKKLSNSVLTLKVPAVYAGRRTAKKLGYVFPDTFTLIEPKELTK